MLAGCLWATESDVFRRKRCRVFKSDCPLFWQDNTICTDTKWSFSKFSRFCQKSVVMNYKLVALRSYFQLEQHRFWSVLHLKVLVSRGGEEEDVDQDSPSIQVNSSCSSCYSSRMRNWKTENMLTFAKCFWFCFSCLEVRCSLQFKRINLSR